MKRPYTFIGTATLIAVAVVSIISLVKPQLLRTPHTMKVEDFGAYWTGTRVDLSGANAYEATNLLPLQQEIEPQRTVPVAAWSPPWTFAAFAPLAPIDFATARWLWRIIQAGTLIAAVTALWQVYGGPPDKLIWAWAASILWYPTLQTLGLGQHSNLVLAGIAGWLACHAAGRHFASGAFLALVLVKPQNVYLLGLVIVLWMLHQRRWRFAAGAISGTAAFTLATLALNPSVFHDYYAAITTRPPSNMVPPTIGMLLRMEFGSDRFWLVFLPPLAGAAWAVWYYVRHRAGWNWPERAPVIILVSCITSPYGWMYDQVLFLVPLMAIFARAAHHLAGAFRVIAVVAGLTALCLAQHAAGFREVTFVWHAPACLIIYLIASATIPHSLVKSS